MLKSKEMALLTIFVTIFFAFIIAQNSAFALPVFPGAEGFGTDTPGGRGGKVFEVTNLNDSGSGSLRACIQASGPRFCLFRVGGLIELQSPLTIHNPYITIAGQTAPGGGITLRNARGGDVFMVKTHDVVIRYLAARPGPGGENHAILIAYNGAALYNIVIDHCSLSWATDEVFTTWYDSHDITIQWSIISEGLDCSTHSEGCHGKGALLGGYKDNEAGSGSGAYNLSFHHNLLAHNGERNPMIKTGGLVDVVNNVLYNPYGVFSYIHFKSPKLVKVNYIANYFKYGPNSGRGKYEIKARSERGAGAEYYVEENIGPHRSANGGQPQDLVVDPSFRTVANPDTTGRPAPHIVTTRWKAPAITTYSAFAPKQSTDAYREGLAKSGNYQGLNCIGNWYPRRDAVDKRVVEDVKGGAGKVIDAPGLSTCVGICRGAGYVLTPADYTKYGINDPFDAGGWPAIASGTACTDSDHDGMPDEWEILHGLNPNDPSDANQDFDGDGYTNLEEYLNGTNPKLAIKNNPAELRILGAFRSGEASY